MTAVDPDDIPTSVTKLVYTAPGLRNLPISQNEAAHLIAHFWPAIREHFAQQLQDQNPDRDADFTAGVDWATDIIRSS